MQCFISNIMMAIRLKHLFLIFPAYLLIFSAGAQTQVSGIVETKSGRPVAGANVYISGSYDGATTDSLGSFSFSTLLAGNQFLMASHIGFATRAITIDVTEDITENFKIILTEVSGELAEVVINAGTFEASDRKKSVVLTPLDVALTASAAGDIYGAFGMLPGSHRVGEEGRLFVRGGESYETKTFMDGMLVTTPYLSKMPDLPTRGRFSPLLFNGAVFSTGGYSAEFGQALSSIVSLNTTALAPENQSSISLLSVGVQGSHTRRWENSSLALTGEAMHTGLTNRIFKNDIQWINDPLLAGSTLMFRHKTSETGMLKTFGSFSGSTSRMLYDNFRESKMQDIAFRNLNTYINTTYNEELNENWIIHSGIAFTIDSENAKPDHHEIMTNRRAGQAKVSFTNISNRITTKTGADYQGYSYNQDIRMDDDIVLSFSNHQLSAFLESEVTITRSLALRAGIRAEHNSAIGGTYVDPRLSAALKTGKYSQISAAYGTFIQNPADDYLKFTTEPGPEKADHSILTWQFRKGTYTLRLEAYYKNYSNLVKFDDEFSFTSGNYSNEGSGYSRGIDVFWRNQKPFGNSDYWVSWSWIDSKRDYRNFPVMSVPHYIADHNLSFVYKRFITNRNSFLSGTWSVASGRPYFNPNNPVFMADRTKPWSDISLGLTHIFRLFNSQAVTHLVVNNIFGFNNIYSYAFTPVPDNNVIYNSRPVTAPQKRMAVILISLQL